MMYTATSIAGAGMTEKHSIAEARRNLPRLVREAERGRTVELTRRGDPVAVLVGCRTFERLAAGRRGFAEAFREFEAAVDLADLAFDPDELFAGARDTAPGRRAGDGPPPPSLLPPSGGRSGGG